MPRRVNDVIPCPEPPKKKNKVVIEEPAGLEASFFDDEALPSGIIFTDVQQKKWRLGKPIGRGSFGRIYLASDEVDKEVTKANARYVVKIEPYTNGPLFVEIHCLIRTAQATNVKSWRQRNKQQHFGMPVYIASGSFTEANTGDKYRFLILPRYDIDLQKIIARTRVLDLKNVLVLAIQILDVLEYFHNLGYTHSDIKSSNLMLGFNGEKLGKFVFAKPLPSFQKETKEVAVLSGKHRRAKSGKGRTSNYYDDEDFIVKDHKSGFNLTLDEEKDKKLASVKNKLRKILSNKDSRKLHRHHAFNLRQLSNYVNYEDMTSSVCSDQSYQRLLDDYGSKQMGYSSDEGFHDDPKLKNVEQTDVYKEAILTQSNGQIYLLDYGLASKFLDSEGNHKDFGMDARKAHDGTLEYSSRDSHIGAHSRRSDLETLGYNILDWLTATLPWKTTEVLAEPDLVHALKKNFMSDIKLLLKTCFKTEFYPQFIEKYLQYVTSLDFTEKPDYDYCRSIFRSELAKMGCLGKELSLNFNEAPMSPMSKKKLYCTKRFGSKNTPQDFLARNGVKKAYERENITSFENDLKLELLKQTLNSSSDGVRKPCASRNFFVSDADLVARLKKTLMPHDVLGKKLSPKNLRSKRKVQKKKGKRTHRSSIGKFGNFMGSARQFTWAEILAGNPEDIIRKERNANTSDNDDEDTCKYRIRKLSNASSNSSNCDMNIPSPLLQKDYLQNLNPTYAMKEVIANLKKKVSGKNVKESEGTVDGIEGYTPAMVKLYRAKEKREAKEALELAKQNSPKKLSEDIQPRTTRSLRSNNTKTPKKTVKKAKIVPKEKPVDDTPKESKAQVNKSKKGTRNISEKKSTRSTKGNVKNVTEVQMNPQVVLEKSPDIADMKNIKSRADEKQSNASKKKTREVTFPTNRRKLRSSKRKKQ